MIKIILAVSIICSLFAALVCDAKQQWAEGSNALLWAIFGMLVFIGDRVIDRLDTRR